MAVPNTITDIQIQVHTGTEKRYLALSANPALPSYRSKSDPVTTRQIVKLTNRKQVSAVEFVI